MIGGVEGGLSNKVGYLSLPIVSGGGRGEWELRWRHVRPNQKRHSCEIVGCLVSSFLILACGVFVLFLGYSPLPWVYPRSDRNFAMRGFPIV